MKQPLLLLLTAAAAWTACCAPAAAASFSEAQAAYTRYNVTEAERLYNAVADDAAAPPKDRASARRELARIAWLVDGDQSKAAALLAKSLKQDPDPCPAALLYGRVLNSGNDHAAIPSKLAPYSNACAEVEPGVAVEAVRALYLAGLRLPLKARSKPMAEALAAWTALPKLAQERLAGARLRLAIGLAAGNGTEALAGWKDYFWLADTSAPQAFGKSDAEVRATFERGARHDAAPADAMALAALLMRAGFAEELRLFAADRRLAAVGSLTARWKPVEAYLNLEAALKADVLAFNRAFARHGKADQADYEKRLNGLLKSAAVQLDSKADDPMPVLNRAYGLWGVVGLSNGVMSLHLGHSVVDERQAVEQHGRHGQVRFIALDNMISNGFSGWLFDGTSGPGGWAASGDTIVQVRPVYAARTDDLVAVTRPGPARERFIAEMTESSSRDIATAREKPVAFLPGLRTRLRLQGLDDLAAGIPPGPQFDGEFRRRYWAAIVNSSITLHEGRHVLDQAEYHGDKELPNAELEYRAKLSEIALSDTPRLALASIYGPLLGGTTGHGMANQRLMEAYVAWIEAHKGEISGYDPALPALPQLDKLSDEQLRAVAQSLDLATRTGSAGNTALSEKGGSSR